MIIEYVARNKDEIDLMLIRFSAQLLNRLETSLPYPLACTLVKPCDSKAQVKVGGVQESYHFTTPSQLINADASGLALFHPPGSPLLNPVDCPTGRFTHRRFRIVERLLQSRQRRRVALVTQHNCRIEQQVASRRVDSVILLHATPGELKNLE
jgi:hypothetical protein